MAEQSESGHDKNAAAQAGNRSDKARADSQQQKLADDDQHRFTWWSLAQIVIGSGDPSLSRSSRFYICRWGWEKQSSAPAPARSQRRISVDSDTGRPSACLRIQSSAICEVSSLIQSRVPHS